MRMEDDKIRQKFILLGKLYPLTDLALQKAYIRTIALQDILSS